jgi:acyl carrier protein
MTEPEIYARLNELFREMFADDSIELKPETTADDIEEWDSFNHLQIIVAVETRFGIKMSTAEIESLKSVGDLVKIIQSKAPAAV